MRWGYLIPRLMIVAGAWAFFAFAFDPLLRWSLIASGRAAVGAEVDVADLDTGFFPPSLEVRKVAVANPADPMTNLVAFDRMRFRVWGRPLLKRKLVVEEGSLTGVAWGTPRETSGALPNADPSEATGGRSFLGGLGDSLKDHAAELGDRWLADLEDRVRAELDPNQLESLRLVRELEADWKARFDDLETRVDDLERRVDALKKDVDEAGKDPFEQIRAYRTAAREVQALLDEAKAIRGELGTLADRARVDFARIEQARKRDLETIKSKADLLKMDGEQITETLLGPTIGEKLDQAGTWLAWVRRYASALTANVQPARLRGLDVVFPRPEDDLPDFLVRQLKLTGRVPLGDRSLPFRGVVTGITSEPARHGDPLVFEAVAEGDATIRLLATIDLRDRVPVYDVLVDYDQPTPLEMRLGDEKLAIAVAAAETDGRVHVRLAGSSIDGNVSFLQSPVRIAPTVGAGVDPKIGRVIASALSGVDSLDVDLVIAGEPQRPEWRLQSNLGPQIAGGLQSYLATELEEQKAKLAAKANALVDERLAELRERLNGRFGEVVAQLELDEAKARQLIQRVAGGGLDPDRVKNPLDLLRR